MGSVAGLFAGPAIDNPEGHSMPKRAIQAAKITEEGMEGDVNHYRYTKRGGDTDMALVLLTTNDLAHLKACGHALGPGDIGENLLLSDIDPHSLGPNVELDIGMVRVQITRICDPCESLGKLPQIGKEGLPSLLKDSIGYRGWYARVILPGKVTIGDEVVVK